MIYVHPAKQDVDFYVQTMGARDLQMGRSYNLIPVGVPALAHVLQAAGVEVRGVNYTVEVGINRTFDLRRWLRTQSQARIVLIDLHWYEHSYGAISLANVCKEVLPDAWVVLGGLTASAFAREILEHFPSVDFVVRGDAEVPLLTLVQRCLAASSEVPPDLVDVPNLTYRQGPQVVENPIGYCASTEDLDRLDFADLGFLDHHDEYLAYEYIVTDLPKARAALATDPYRGRWITTARGCKYECSYCGGCRSAHRVLATREGIVPRSPEAVVDEIERLAAAGVDQVSLSYDIAEMGDDYWRAFFSLMRRRRISIGLYNECFQLPPLQFIKQFARVADPEHSCLTFSPLSGSERVRRLNGKLFSNAELMNVLDYVNLNELYMVAYFSLNLPGETEETLAESIGLARQMVDLYPASRIKILSSCHTLDPLSPMAVHPEKYAIEVTMGSFMDWYAYCRDTQLGGPEARTEAHRGFAPSTDGARRLEAMADTWDAARQGHEECWWPMPPSW